MDYSKTLQVFKIGVFLCCFISISNAVDLLVSEHDLTFEINENGTFSVSLSQPAKEDFTVWFNYTDGNNLYEFPNNRVIRNGTTGDLAYVVRARSPGHTTVIANTTPPLLKTKNAFVRVGVYKVHGWVVVSSVIGWLYFICWSISFYPQIIENFKRKSVVGLNFDFLGLNITGFIAYAVFNVGLRYVREVQLEYHSIHPTGVIPVEVNDVVFALHAVFATAVTIGQCFIYDRGNQLISKMTVGVLAVVWSTAAVFLLLTALDINKTTPWLTFLYFFSYVKLGVTLVKYIPQVVLNYKRKSTVGWSIGTVLLDFIGGLFSIGQMFIIAYNFDDWYSIIGNLTKFGLGLASISFDVMFMVQHFCLYRHRKPDDSLENSLIE